MAIRKVENEWEEEEEVDEMAARPRDDLVQHRCGLAWHGARADENGVECVQG